MITQYLSKLKLSQVYKCLLTLIKFSTISKITGEIQMKNIFHLIYLNHLKINCFSQDIFLLKLFIKEHNQSYIDSTNTQKNTKEAHVHILFICGANNF